MWAFALAGAMQACTCGTLVPSDDAGDAAPIDAALEHSFDVFIPDCGADAKATFDPNGGCDASPLCVAESWCTIPGSQGCSCADNSPVAIQCTYNFRPTVPVTGNVDCLGDP